MNPVGMNGENTMPKNVKMYTSCLTFMLPWVQRNITTFELFAFI